MADLALSISPAFAEAGLEVTLGLLEAEVTVLEGDARLGTALDAAAAERMREVGGGAPADVPEIAAARRAYKALGKDPSRYRPSVEALLRRVLQGKGLFRVNNVVDVNNLVSLATGYCIGAYDRAQLSPPITFRPGQEEESYDAIGRGPLNLQNLPLLSDADGPFGSPTSDSERSMIRPETRRLLMVLYGFEAPGAMDAALDVAAESLAVHCHAQQVQRRILGTRAQGDSA